MTMAEAITSDCGFPEGTVDDIAKGSCVSIAGTTSCVWLQSATFGWGISATHVFVHAGAAGAPMEIDGRVVKRAGVATAEELDAFLGRGKRQCLPDACDMMDDCHDAQPGQCAEPQAQVPAQCAEPQVQVPEPADAACGAPCGTECSPDRCALSPEIPMAQRTY